MVTASRPARGRSPEIQRKERERAREQRRKQRAQRNRNTGPIGFSLSRTRVLSGAIVFVLLAVGYVVRLADIQLVQGAELAARAKELRTTEIELTAERGDISDRNGNPVAKSVTRYKIFADQELVQQWKTKDDAGNIVGGPDYAAQILAPVLGLSEQKLQTLLTRPEGQKKYNKYQTLVTEVPPETWEAVKQLKITGVFPETLNKRIYPSGDTAKNIIGVVGKDGGLSGLEYTLEDMLKGKAGSLKYERSLDGYVLPSGSVVEEPNEPGKGIKTTFDMDIQWHAEKALDEQLKKTGGAAGSVIVQDVKTCEILALADRSTTADGNTAFTGRIGAVQDIFEPGSTAKVITMAAALERGEVTPLSEFRVPYQYATDNGQVFKDSHEHPTQKLTLTGILADSSNTGTVQVGEKLPKQVRYDYLYKFGFGQKTGIELGGESRGILHKADDWDGRTKYGVLFGQGMAGNALQATNVFATIANDGKQCKPHLVAGYTEPDGTFVESEKSETTQTVSKKTADQVLKMMESVVVEGSGKAGAISGYRVAGKTGTSQAPDENGKLTRIVSSFIGVAPVDNPEIAVSVVIRDPRSGVWGGEVSAPVFADVMAYSLQRLGVEPTGSKPDLYSTTWK